MLGDDAASPPPAAGPLWVPLVVSSGPDGPGTRPLAAVKNGVRPLLTVTSEVGEQPGAARCRAM